MPRVARWVAVCGFAAACAAPGQGRAADDGVAGDRMEQARRSAEGPLRWIIESGTQNGGAAARAAPAPAPARPIAPAAPAARPRPAPKAEAPPPTRVDADEASASTAAVAVVAVPAPMLVATDAVMATVPARVALPPPAPPGREEPKLVLKKSAQPDLRASDCLLNGCFGTLTVSYTVEPDGSVSHPRLLRPSSNARLNASVLAAVLQWRYEPIARPVEHQTALRLARD